MHPGICVLGGVLAGVVGTTFVQSKSARNLAVKGLVAGMKAKDGITTLIDDAKVEFDDLLAEASYEKASAEAEDSVVVIEEIEAVEEVEDPVAQETPKPAARTAHKKTAK